MDPVSTTGMNTNELISKILTLLVPVLSAFGGYYLRGKESEKEFLRDRMTDIIEDVKSLQETSAKYWSRIVEIDNRSDIDIYQEEEMLALNHSIVCGISSMSQNISATDYADLNNIVIHLRQSSTGANFATDLSRDKNPMIIRDVYANGQNLINKLRYCSMHLRGIWMKKRR